MDFYNEYTLCNMIAYGEYDPSMSCNPAMFEMTREAISALWRWIAPKLSSIAPKPDALRPCNS